MKKGIIRLADVGRILDCEVEIVGQEVTIYIDDEKCYDLGLSDFEWLTDVKRRSKKYEVKLPRYSDMHAVGFMRYYN